MGGRPARLLRQCRPRRAHARRRLLTRLALLGMVAASGELLAPAAPAGAAAGATAVPMWAWGSNFHGELADGTQTDRLTAVRTLLTTGVTSVAGGWTHGLAVVDGGQVKAWGLDSEGALGNGHPYCYQDCIATNPTAVPGLSGVRAVGASEGTSVALTGSGGVWAWGRNDWGQAGQRPSLHAGQAGGSPYSYVPTPQPIPSLAGVTGVSESGGLAIRPGGTVAAWGLNSYGQLGVDPISTNTAASCPRVYDTDGQDTCSYIPVTPAGLPAGMIAVSNPSQTTSYALEGSSGRVWAWGYGSYGSLGDGSECDVKAPCANSHARPVVGDHGTGELTGVGCPAAAPPTCVPLSGPLALKTNGTVWAWGDNASGGLGVPPAQTKCAYILSGSGQHLYQEPCSSVPVQIRDPQDPTGYLTGVVSVHFPGLAIKSDGSLWSWGYNASGQLGDGTVCDANTGAGCVNYIPRRVTGLTAVSLLGSGNGFAFAVSPGGPPPPPPCQTACGPTKPAPPTADQPPPPPSHTVPVAQPGPVTGAVGSHATVPQHAPASGHSAQTPPGNGVAPHPLPVAQGVPAPQSAPAPVAHSAPAAAPAPHQLPATTTVPVAAPGSAPVTNPLTAAQHSAEGAHDYAMVRHQDQSDPGGVMYEALLAVGLATIGVGGYGRRRRLLPCAAASPTRSAAAPHLAGRLPRWSGS